MCGRFVQYSSPELYANRYDLDRQCETQPRYNLAPTQPVLGIRVAGDGRRELAVLRWGLVPSWSKGPDNRYSMINARAETVAIKPAYRNAFKIRRCLIPSEGFYEWHPVAGEKQPYLIHRGDNQPFVMAGLWELWRGEGDQLIESCTIIVTDANQAISPIHDRMPVVLDGTQIDTWLDPDNHDPTILSAMLRPAPTSGWTLSVVSKRVNNPRNQGPELIEPIAR